MKKVILSTLLILTLSLILSSVIVFAETENQGSGTMMYLSDMSDYVEGQGGVLKKIVGWGSYGRDVNPDGGTLSVNIQGKGRVYFLKGIGAHAAADLVYDLGSSNTYDKFSGYFAIDASRGSNGYAKIIVYASNNDSNWGTAIYETEPMRGNTTVSKTVLNISGKRYIRIVCDSLQSNAADHTIIADAKVYSNDYVRPEDATLEEFSYYEGILKTAIDNGATYKELLNNADTKLALMQRMFIEKFGPGEVGVDALILDFFEGENGERHRNLVDWLFNDAEALEELMSGGDPDSGSYSAAMDTLSRLYETYGDDLDDNTTLFVKTGDISDRKKGDVYRTMMFAIALSGNVYSWLNNANPIDPLDRYAKFKSVYLAEKYHLRYDIFENLCLEEMRYVMNIRVWNDELYWLNAYSRIKTGNETTTASTYPNVYSPHRHLKYGKDWDYAGKGYLTESNFAPYSTKYLLKEYGVYFSTVPKLWMVFEGSHICWGISYVGTNFAAAYGVPSHYVLQPGHAAFFVMQRDSQGRITWSIDNNIYGWTQTRLNGDTVARGNSRMLCDWGTASKGWMSSWQGSYILLSQYALNHEEEYKKAELLMSMISYAGTVEEKENIYRQVLNIMPYHLDAWYDLIQLYIANKTSQELAGLADELGEAMKYFPLPMHDLMNEIKNKIQANTSDSVLKATLTAQVVANEERFLYQALDAQTNGPADQTQKDVAVAMAKSLLGGVETALADFSFDGDDGGSIVFSNQYSGVRFKYSLDGGRTWSDQHITTATELKYRLSDEEVAEISAENDILIWLEGWTSDNNNQPDAEKAFCIDIKAGTTVSGVEANDNENRFIGDCSGMEYSTDNGATWNNLTDEVIFDGEASVKVHKKASGRVLQGSNSQFTFTDNYSENRAYIPISRLTLADYSSQETSKGDDAFHAIDGKLSTRWHTLWNGSDKDKYITLKVNEPTYFAGIDYTPIANAGNGTLYACEVYASLDGTTWYPAGSATGWARNSTVKHLTFKSPVYGQYIKIVGTSSVGGFVAARLIEVFEDRTMLGKTMLGIKLDSLPEKLEYEVGEKLDLEGMSVYCYYADGTKMTLPNVLLSSDCTVLNESGSRTVNVSYLYLPKVSFTVKVSENTRTATQINVEKTPDKTTYFTGQTLDLAGLEISAEDANGKWYPSDYTVSPTVLNNSGKQTVTIRYQGKKTSLEITVSERPETITIKNLPTKQTYEIGEGFETEGLSLEVEYADGTKRVLSADSDEYSLNMGNFSALPGEKTIDVSVLGYPAVKTSIPVTVLSNLDLGDYRYDVLPSADGTYRCYLSGYTNSTETIVSVPDKVTVNDITYQVIGVRGGAFDGASQIINLSLPGSIQHIESGALTALTNLENLYLTGISDINNLTIDDGSLPEGTTGSIIMANSGLSGDLSEILEDYESETDEGFLLQSSNILSGNQIKSMSIDEPTQKYFEIGEAMNYSGLEVRAELENGIILPLGNHQYTINGGENTKYGSRNVTVSINGTKINKTYTIEVMKTAPVIEVHPQDRLYQSEDIAEPLEAGVSGEAEDYVIKWYFSSDDSFSVEDDKFLLNGSQCVPSNSGYYYAQIFRKDAENQLSNPAQTMAAHIRFGDFPVTTEGGLEGYASLAEAFAEAEDGTTLVVKRNITINESISSVKKLYLKGENDGITITRAAGFKGPLFSVSDGSLTVKNIIIDGNDKVVTADNGIFLLTGTSTLTLGKGCIIQNAKTSGKGGAVNIVDGTNAPSLKISGATIQNCSANSYGGAVFVNQKGSVTMTSGKFFQNSAVSLGGAICTNSYVAGKVLISGGTFEENSANYGGAIGIGGSSTSEISGGTFKNNSATTKGSVICYYNGGTHIISGGTFEYSGNFCAEDKVGTATITVKGGRFSKVPSYIATGYKVGQSGDFYLVVPKGSFKSVEEGESTTTLNFYYPLSGKIIIAGYESSGRMVYCQTETIESETSVIFNCTDAATIKCFIIDGDKLRPLEECYKYTA